MKSLFSHKTIAKKCEDIDITDNQKKSALKWIDMIEKGKLDDEKSNYINFYQIILHDILGYDENDIKYEKNNVEFQIIDGVGKTILCCEIKGTRIKNLSANQHYSKKELRTPINQTHYYMYKLNLDYGLCSNYKQFILLDRDKNTYEFDFESIKKNESKLKEFVGIFSKYKLTSSEFLQDLHKESDLEEKEFTKQFYKLFHETRLMMIKEFQEKNHMEKSISIHMTQIILNRLIFIFFAEDTGLIFENHLFYDRMIRILKSNTITDTSKKIFEDMKDIFTAFDKGSTTPSIFPFNGGLFSGIIPDKIYFRDKYESNFFDKVIQNSSLSKLRLNDDMEILMDRIGNLNPIIRNLMIMESFDFNTEVNVNILGHIFEQSISDLEELQGNSISAQHQEGIYYTPEYVTDYMCRNTIISYLSKSGNTENVFDLISEYENDLENLEKKFLEIKILDPACGSGAFLIKAIDILLDIGKAILDHKQSHGLYHNDEEQPLLTKWTEESEIERIIENNVYGVDINPQSVDVTKLSLCLRLVSKNRKLPDLGKNIVLGNSLISDKTINLKALDWYKKFPEVMNKNGGFDIVIGNPPYLDSELMKKTIPNERDYYSNEYTSASGNWDIFCIFIEKSILLNKKNGKIGLIVPNKLLSASYSDEICNILRMYNINILRDYSTIDVFPDAQVYPIIIILTKTNYDPNNNIKIEVMTNKLNNHLPQIDIQKTLKQKELHSIENIHWSAIFANKSEFDLFKKIYAESIKLKDHVDFEINGAATVNEAYKIKGFIHEIENLKNGKKFINTGTIDPYLSLWGIRHTRYLGSSYKFPVIDVEKLKKMNLNRYEQARSPKIILAGMTKGLEAYYDLNADYVAGKSTIIIISKKNDNLKLLLVLLNSKLYSFLAKNQKGALLANGYLKIGTSLVKELPFKIPENPHDLLYTADIILKYTMELIQESTKFYNRLIDNLPINKITRNFELFYNYDFKQFLCELKKHDVILTLKDQDEWEKYFIEYKHKLLKLQNQIDQLNSKINMLVYDLYDLTNDEIELIEKL